MKAIDLAGAPADIGFQHGQALAAEIRECLQIYQQVIGVRFSEIAQTAQGFAVAIRQFAPDLAAEMEGIAAGAGVEPYEITLLNARSELMSSADAATDGCTAIYQPAHALLAQTWDWIEAIEPLFRILRIQKPDGRTILTATEPGMVGKIGFNSSGLGCTLNFMYSPGLLRGTPIHVLLRQILECTSIEAVQAVIAQRTPGQSGNIMVAVANAGGVNFEFAGNSVSENALDSAPFVHTNHHLNRDISAGTLTPDTHARHRRATKLICEHQVSSVAEMAAVLSNTEDIDYSICTPYKPLLGTQIGTVSTVVMELADPACCGCGWMHVRRGPDPDGHFQAVPLVNTLSG